MFNKFQSKSELSASEEAMKQFFNLLVAHDFLTQSVYTST